MLRKFPNEEFISAAHSYLFRYFGYKSLKAHQISALIALNEGQDVLLITPTGSGKSICYVLPALLSEGLTLVISPLISLMKDQINNLQKHNINAAALNSTQTPAEKMSVLKRVEENSLKLLYVSPERLANETFRKVIKTKLINLIAIDEAHCISEWGHGFRKEYSNIGAYLEGIIAPKIALTATSTPIIEKDILKVLKIKKHKRIYVWSLPQNLKIKIFRYENEHLVLANILQNIKQTTGQGIVYVQTKKKAEQVNSLLNKLGIKSLLYHGGLKPSLRKDVSDQFSSNNKFIVVATSAFGLGIDKSNIRFVYHLGLPFSLEQYVQEIGRAGRDKKPADAFLFYCDADLYIKKFMINNRRLDCSHKEGMKNTKTVDEQTKFALYKLQKMYEYVSMRGDRRVLLNDYFSRN